MAGAVSNLMVRAGFDGSQLTRGLQQMQGDLRGAQTSIGSTLGTIGKVTAVAVAAAGAAMAAMGGYIAKTGIAYNAMQESSQVAWTTLLGSTTKAKQMIQDIATFAAKTQFDTEGVDAMAKYLNNAGYSGQKLFDQLGRIADVSGAFNITADNAKELVRQMSQVDQAQVAYTSDLDILQNQGVPIFKAIAAEMHTNVAGVRQMASQGKITSDIYDKAFNSIANTVKGSADKQSATWNGMMSTLKDDFSILSGILAKPLFNVLHDSLNRTLNVMNAFVSLSRGDLKGFSDTMTQTFGAGTTKQINNFISGVKEGFSNGFGQMQTSVGTFGAFLGNAFYNVQNVMKNLSKYANDFIKGMKEGFTNGFGPMQTVIGTIGAFVGNTFYNMQTAIVNFIKGAKEGFSNGFGEMQTKIGTFGAFFGNAFYNIQQFVKNLLSGKDSIVNSFISIFNTIKSIVTPILNDIVKFIGSEFAQISAWWDQYGGQITQSVKNFFAVLAAIFRALAPILLFIIKMVWDNIKGVIDGAIKIIEGIILVFTGIFTGHWNTLWTGIKDILGGALEIIWNAIQLLFIGKLLKGIGSFFGLLKELFSGGWTSIVNGLKLFVDDAGTWFAKFLDTAKGNFDKIVDAAKNIPDGIVKGLKSGVRAIEDAIGGLATTLVDKFKKTLGIASPSKVFTEMGGHILSGLVNGLTSGNLLDLGKAVFKDFGGGIFSTVDKIKGFLKGVFSGGASGNAAGWIQSALSIVGAPSSWLGPLSTLVQHESGGDPNAINLWDSNAKAGHPSKGLFQTIDSTFASYAIKGLGDIYNPVANAVAGIRYIMDRYGSVFNVPGIKSMMNGGAYQGYASGTNSATAGWHWVGENGPELMRFNGGEQVKNNRESNRMLSGTNKTYNVTVNSLQASMDEKDLVRALQRMEALNYAQ